MGALTKFFHKDKPIAGIDFSATGIKIMAIDPKRMTVLGYGAIDLDPIRVQEGLIKNDSYLADGIKKLLDQNLIGHIPSTQVAASVPTSRTYLRIMTVPLKAESNLDEAIQIEAEQYIPVPPAELYMDYEVIERDKDNLTVLLAATPRHLADSVISSCMHAGLDVVVMEPGISAAARLIKATEEGHLPSIIIDVGAATTDIGLLDGVVRVTGGVAIGGHTFTLKIAEKLKVPLQEAHQLKVHNGLAMGARQTAIKSALEPSLNQITSEIRKIIRYYTERIGAKTKVEQIIIVGGGSNMPGLGDFITDTMLMPARVANPWQALDFGKLPPPQRLFKPRYVNAAGLALIEPSEIWPHA